MRRIVVGGLMSLALVVSSCKSDPDLPQTWEKRIAGTKNTKEKLKAVDDLRSGKHMGPKMVPMLEKRGQRLDAFLAAHAAQRVSGAHAHDQLDVVELVLEVEVPHDGLL